MPFSDDRGLLIRQYPEGVQIFQKGDEATQAYFIKEGRVRIFKKDEKGKEIPLGVAEEGDIIGEMSMLRGHVRTSYAEALEKSTLVIINKDVLDEKIKKADPLIAAIINVLIKRLYKAQA